MNAIRGAIMPEPAAENQRGSRLVSYALPCPEATVEDFLWAARGQPRFYWADAWAGFTVAGAGITAELMAWGGGRFGAIQEQARALFAGAALYGAAAAAVGPRLFGGFAFQDDSLSDIVWADYAPAHFVLPHYQFIQAAAGNNPAGRWLLINVQVSEDEPVEALWPALGDALAAFRAALLARRFDRPPATSPAPGGRITSLLAYPDWAALITRALERIHSGALRKVVLARVCEAHLAAPAQLEPVLAYLARHYGDCFRFWFEPRPHRAFFGATPERLVRTTGAALETMALAGSARRGQSPAEDAALEGQLLNDPKERHEHQLVIDSLRARLAPLTTSLDAPPTSVLKLSNIQHLHTPVHGVLRQPEGVVPLVATLHPTPALGGVPREQAMQFIGENERLPRGWYAAPVGWIGPDLDGDFAVAIRSAVAQERRVWLYAGAGIVAESIPAQEWAETALKFRPMLGALGLTEAADGQP